MKKLLTLLAILVASCSLLAQNNVITYTASEQLVETTNTSSYGLHTDAFNVAIVSHTFVDGTGMITFAEDVTSIGFLAFYGCFSLISISIPEGVTSIGQHAFYDCFGLTSIEIPSSVTGIDGNVFHGCSGLTSIVVEQGNAIYDSRNNCNAIIETASNTLISGCQNTLIPNSVTSIGDGAFYDCFGLTSIEIPSSVTGIGDWAFFGCFGLTSIGIPSGVLSIGGQAFSNCSGLTSIVVEQGNAIYDSRNNCNAIIETASNTLISGCQNTLIPNSVTSIGDYAFEGCSNLKTMIIPEGVTSIGGNVFNGCSGLMSVIIPNSVTNIENIAFSCCYSLTSIEIPNSVTSIGPYAFFSCYSLTSIEIPSSVTSIGDRAFYGCSGLTLIGIPSSVTSIGDDAFSDCSGLTAITSLATTPPVLGAAVFDGVPHTHTIPLYVPAASVSLYQTAEQWREFDVQPLLVEINPVVPQVVEMTWNPVDSASLYQLHLYTDSTSTIALDTILLINADSINGGIMLQNGTSVARRVKKIVQDAGGTIIVITIDPTSGTSEENPYKVTVSTVSGERIDVHFDMKVYQGIEILREESGTFVLNEPLAPTGVENILAPSLPTGIYDLYGHRYPAEAWESLPAGVYVVREEDRVEKVMK